MGFALDISLNPNAFGGENVAKVFEDVGYVDNGTGRLRRVAATAMTAPETLTVSHRRTKESSGVSVDQHLVRLDNQIVTAGAGTVKYSCWLVIRNPVGVSEVTAALIKSQVGRLVAFQQAANATDNLLNGSI